MNMCTKLHVVSRGNVDNQIGLMNLLRQRVVPTFIWWGVASELVAQHMTLENEGKDFILTRYMFKMTN